MTAVPTSPNDIAPLPEPFVRLPGGALVRPSAVAAIDAAPGSREAYVFAGGRPIHVMLEARVADPTGEVAHLLGIPVLREQTRPSPAELERNAARADRDHWRDRAIEIEKTAARLLDERDNLAHTSALFMREHDDMKARLAAVESRAREPGGPLGDLGAVQVAQGERPVGSGLRPSAEWGPVSSHAVRVGDEVRLPGSCRIDRPVPMGSWGGTVSAWIDASTVELVTPSGSRFRVDPTVDTRWQRKVVASVGDPPPSVSAFHLLEAAAARFGVRGDDAPTLVRNLAKWLQQVADVVLYDAAYERVSTWYEAGCPVPSKWGPSGGSAYLRAGLPGWAP